MNLKPTRQVLARLGKVLRGQSQQPNKIGTPLKKPYLIWKVRNFKSGGNMKKKKRKLQRHHNKAKSRFKSKAGDIFLLTPEHHQHYHALFGLRTFKEASQVLARLAEKGERR